MPPGNAKITSTLTTAQRAAQRATRAESRATSLNGSCTEMYREAYQGRMSGNGNLIGSWVDHGSLVVGRIASIKQVGVRSMITM
ncbi:hypothetical protein Bca52824_011498 [Brassica carinata]|uniref:Uncharacterized protein n=1 Tax=Brassica carinata TaxID=52824 RepID=A0A8X7WH92_BRACI|nr:hypothetical protein Bca52824_011498 [Brassica carinata]